MRRVYSNSITRSNQILVNCVRSECSIVKRIVFHRGTINWKAYTSQLCEIYSNLIDTYTALIIYMLDLPLKYSVEFMQVTRPKVEKNNNVIIGHFIVDNMTSFALLSWQARFCLLNARTRQMPHPKCQKH